MEPPAGRFKDALIADNRQCETALALSSYFGGDEAEIAMVKNLATTVRNLRGAVLKKSLAADDDL